MWTLRCFAIPLDAKYTDTNPLYPKQKHVLIEGWKTVNAKTKTKNAT